MQIRQVKRAWNLLFCRCTAIGLGCYLLLGGVSFLPTVSVIVPVPFRREESVLDAQNLEISLYKGELCIQRFEYFGLGEFPRYDLWWFPTKENWEWYHRRDRSQPWWCQTEVGFHRISIWLVGIPVIFLPWFALAPWRWIARRRRRKRGSCVHCGYSLTGLTEPRCPECGTPFDKHRSR
jgi:hypothetical protein